MQLGDVEAALFWAGKELELERYYIGDDHPECEKLAKVVELLEVAVETSGPLDESIRQWSET